MQFLNFLPYILNLMTIAERLFSGQAKSGIMKKDLVMSTAQTVLTAAEDFSTGGQKNTWDRIAPHVSSIVDSAATIMFKPEDDAAASIQGNGNLSDERG